MSLAGPAKAGLEDKFRPHFFDGVATVVAKLFLQTAADFAMFGEKDYQQLLVVTRMAKDLDIPIEVIGVPTMREADGLAMSSRNRYLSKTERQQAPAIHRSLDQAAEKIRQGTDPQKATRAAARSLTTLGFKVDYVTARNAETLAVPVKPGEPLRLLAAAWLGKTRLIDNMAVQLQQPELRQFPPHLLREALDRRTLWQIGRRVGGFEIAPSLEGPPRCGPHRNDLRLEIDTTAGNAVLALDRHEIGDRLAAQDHSSDHPVERASVQYLVPALGKHPRCVVETVTPGLAIANPLFEFLDFGDADAEFDEIEGHDPENIAG